MLKIINIVENLDKGAVENWLVRIFLESRKYRPNWEWTFYCILGEEGRLDKIVKNAGGVIIYSPVPLSKKVQFLNNLRTTLVLGEYDIIHSHHDYLSGFYLLSTIGIKFRRKILHIHNTDKALPVGNRLIHNFLLPIFKFFCLHLNDTIVGISNDTLQEFIGKTKKIKPKTRVLYYGVDFKEAHVKIDRNILRKELGIPESSKILVFVGRMNKLKNPVFVVDILKYVLLNKSDVYVIFVGKGDLEIEVLNRAKTLDIQKNIFLLGWRDDIYKLLKSSDAFIFPRLEYPREGLGLVIIEAQASGLPLFITKGIVDDAIVIKELAFFSDISNNEEIWAKKILNVLKDNIVIDRKDALDQMEKSVFSLGNGTENLINIYEK